VPLPFVHTSAPIYLAGVARPGPDGARQPRGARRRPAAAARPDRPRAVLVGQARAGAVRRRARRRGRRPRRHAHGGDDQPHGRLVVRLAPLGRGARGDGRRGRAHPAPAHDDVRRRRRRALGGRAARPGGAAAR
jgi:hypothetical protein